LFEKGEEATVAEVAALLDVETYGRPDVVIKKKSRKTMEVSGEELSRTDQSSMAE
jgi:hypothetical protein